MGFMDNSDIKAAWDYHNGTKHSNGFLMDPLHYFDPLQQPLLFKIYKGIEPIPLPFDASASMPALEAISAYIELRGRHVPDIRTLSRILYFSAGITKRIKFPPPWGEIQFRAASCTGALYHIDLYIVCGDLPGLEAGVYHFDPKDFALRRLRKGDYRNVLVDATENEPSITHAPLIIVYADTFWRNACKYQAREYRHAFWDCGTMLSHTFAMCSAHGLPAKAIAGFADPSVNRLLSLDTMKEVSLVLVPIGHSDDRAVPFPPVESLSLETVPISEWEKDFPSIREMHEASSLLKEVTHWRGSINVASQKPSGKLFSLQPYTKDELPKDTIEPVIIRRGSTRRFSQESMTFRQLSTILHYSTEGIPSDFEHHGTSLSQPYLIVNAVDGLPSGSFFFHRDVRALELLREGDFRHTAGYLGLNQALPYNASVDVFFLSDLRPILERFGNRGYRAAQLEASIIAGKMYLAAYAQGLGATGLTFFDDAVTDFFSPHAKDKSVMFLMALGKRAKGIS